MKRASRFSRIVPPASIKKKTAPRKPREIDGWEQKARLRYAFPFTEVIVKEEKTYGILEQDEEVKKTFRRRVTPSHVHPLVKSTLENALAQSYISGYVAAARQIDILIFAMRHYCKNKKFLREVEHIAKRIKTDLADGTKGV